MLLATAGVDEPCRRKAIRFGRLAVTASLSGVPCVKILLRQTRRRRITMQYPADCIRISSTFAVGRVSTKCRQFIV